MHLGLVILFLVVGPSSGSHLLREDWAGWHRIGGQDVELTLYRHRGYRIVFRTQFLTFRCAFELCRLYSNLLCKTCVVN